MNKQSKTIKNEAKTTLVVIILAKLCRVQKIVANYFPIKLSIKT